MYERVLDEMRAKIRVRHYVMTVHADEEMDADGLSVFDVENAVLTGRIVERQVDRLRSERQYLVRGRPLEGDDFVVVVAKMGPMGKVVFLTVHSE